MMGGGRGPSGAIYQEHAQGVDEFFYVALEPIDTEGTEENIFT